uniref:(northern house mosquito) hypothetical protein n=1 Tax=Culex pipiens TaxID=7175 RepID=A0A8D8JJ62_CULPI
MFIFCSQKEKSKDKGKHVIEAIFFSKKNQAIFMGSIISSSKSNYRKSKNPLTLIKLLQSKLLTTRQQVVTYLVVVVKITSLAKETHSHTHTYTNIRSFSRDKVSHAHTQI